MILKEYKRNELLQLSDDNSKWNRYKKSKTISNNDIAFDELEVDTIAFVGDNIQKVVTDGGDYDNLSDEEKQELIDKGFDYKDIADNPQEIITYKYIQSKTPDLMTIFTCKSQSSLHTYDIMVQWIDFIKVLDERGEYYFNNGYEENPIEEVIKNDLLGLLDECDIKVWCECSDWYYRFSYMADQNDYGLMIQTIPAPIRNPNTKGAMCKHINKLLDNPNLWIEQLSNKLIDIFKKLNYN